MSARIRQAVIPIAGLGTRLFPASHAMKKELFPVVGSDGIARALFHYHLIELAAAGFEQVCIIVQPGEDELVRAYLRGPGDEYLRRLRKYPALQAEAANMRSWLDRISFAVQTTQDGYGHAVLQSRAFVGDEPFLLCLGDHLFRGVPVSPYRELVEQWTHSGGKSVSAVNRISPAELKGYGTIAGRRRANLPRLIDVSLIIEKPAVEVARAQLQVDGLAPDEFLGWFGMHLLAPSIFDVLAQMIRDDVRDAGEFQLTRAQEIQRQRDGYCALEMTQARRFDFGTPADYVAALQAFASPSSP